MKKSMRIITYDPNDAPLEVYSDTNHARDKIYKTSTWCGVVYIYGCPLVVQVSTLNPEISTAHVEYVGGSMAADLGLGIQDFMKEIDPANQSIQDPLKIHMDASSAIHAAVCPAMLPKFKHIAIHAQKLRTSCQYGLVELVKVSSENNTADMGTKPATSLAEYLKHQQPFMQTHEELLAKGYTIYEHTKK